MGGHTELVEVYNVEGFIRVLREAEKKCRGEYGLHFRFAEVRWVEEKQRFVGAIRYTK